MEQRAQKETPVKATRLGEVNTPDSVKIQLTSPTENYHLKKLRIEEQRVKDNIARIQATLAQNQELLKAEKEQERTLLNKQKRRENYEFKKSMGDGRAKHPSIGFLKANKEITYFEQLKLLIPPIQLARDIRQEKDQKALQRRTFLKTRVESDTEMPWQPTKGTSEYFDNLFQLKPPNEYKQVSAQLSSTTAAILRNRQISSLYHINEMDPLQTISNQPTRPATSINLATGSAVPQHSSRRKQISLVLDDNGEKIRSQSILENLPIVKPTSANNLAVFQQQLSHERAQSRNAFSSTSLNRQHKHSSLVSSSKPQSREWINAYHEKQVFSQPRCDNLDIKLQGNNPHFKPFKPTKTKGYDFDKYISLEAAERNVRAAPKSLLNFDALDDETFDIAPKKHNKQL